jgi:hypothetical protein
MFFRAAQNCFSNEKRSSRFRDCAEIQHACAHAKCASDFSLDARDAASRDKVSQERERRKVFMAHKIFSRKSRKLI